MGSGKGGKPQGQKYGEAGDQMDEHLGGKGTVEFRYF